MSTLALSYKKLKDTAQTQMRSEVGRVINMCVQVKILVFDNNNLNEFSENISQLPSCFLIHERKLWYQVN